MHSKSIFSATLLFHAISLFSFSGCNNGFLATDTVQLSGARLLALEYSPDGSKLAALNRDGSVFLIDTTLKTILAQSVLPGWFDSLDNLQSVSLKFSADSQMLYTCTHIQNRVDVDFEISKWNPQNTTPPLPILHLSSVDLPSNSLQYSCQSEFLGDWFVLPEKKNQLEPYLGLVLNIYDIHTGSYFFSISDGKVRDGYVNQFLFVHAPAQLIGGNQVWDLRRQHKIFDTDQDVSILDIHSDEKLLLRRHPPIVPRSAPINQLTVQNIKTQAIQDLNFPNEIDDAFVTSATFSSDGNRVAVALNTYEGDNTNYYWCVWDLTHGDLISYKKYAHYSSQYFISPRAKISFLPTVNNRIMTYNIGPFADPKQVWGDQLWDTDSGNQVARFEIKDPNSGKLAFGLQDLKLSPTQDQVTTIGVTPGEILFWELSEL